MNENEPNPDEVLDGVIEVHRADQAYLLKMSGKSLSEIADELGFGSISAVAEALRRRFDAQARTITSLERQSILTMELDRLDMLQAGSWESAVYGDPKAVDICLKIIALRAKLLRLDQPEADVSQQTVLVIGGQERDYVAKLKELVVHEDDEDAKD